MLAASGLKRTNARTDKEQIPFSLSQLNSTQLFFCIHRRCCSNICCMACAQVHSQSAHSLFSFFGTQPFLLFSTQPFLLFGTQPPFVQLCILISSATVGLSRPAAAVAVPGPQLLRIALIDRPSHACTDMTHYIQVRYIPQARDPSRCNGQARMKPVGQAWAKHTKALASPY